MTDIKLDPSAVQDLIHGAILNAISTDARDALIESALKHLMTPQRSYAGQQATPLAEAFTQAVRSAAQKVVMESVRDDERVQAKIRELVSPTIAAICDGNYDGLPEAIGAAFASWLSDQKRR